MSIEQEEGAPWAGGAVMRALPIWLALAFVAGRVALAPALELIADEAYYWNYAQHLALSYLDHPPLVGWTIAITTAVLGNTELGVRLPALLAGLITTAGAWRLGTMLFGRRAGAWTAALAAGLPFFFACGTPDALLVAAWTLSLLFLSRALIDGRSRAWTGVAVAFGIGLLAKYAMVLLALAALLFMLADKDSRRWFARPQPYAAGIVALLLFLPVVAWNAEHGWASFLFQSARRFETRSGFGLHRMIMHNLVLVTPVMVALLPAALRRFEASGREARARHLLLLAFAVPMGVFLAYSLFARVQPHWSGPAWIAALPLLGRAIARAEAMGRRALPLIATATLGLLALLYPALYAYEAAGLPGNPAAIVNRHYFWREAAAAIDGAERDTAVAAGRDPVVIGMSKWSIASALAFYGRFGDPALTTSQHLFGLASTMGAAWFDRAWLADRPVIVVAFRERDLHRAKGLIEPRPPERLVIRGHGRVLRDLWVVRAKGIVPTASGEDNESDE